LASKRAWCGMDTAYNYLLWALISISVFEIGLAVMVW
jgi:hypothetical protein